MPKFKSLISLFLIRSLVIGAVFGFVPVNTLADEQELYSQPYLFQIGVKYQTNNFSNSPITVAIIDEGIDFTHPLLSSDQWTNVYEQTDGVDNDGNNFSDDIYGWNFLNNSNNTSPLGGHGTKLAGIVKTISNKSGVNVKFMSLIACSQNNGCNVPAVAKAIHYAVDKGAKIINLSLGTNSYDQSLDEPVQYAFSKGVVIVTAAGNGNDQGQGLNLDQNPISPICNDQGQNMVLGVSSADENNNPTAWANFGSCVDVLAPAKNIYTSFSPQFNNQLSYGYVEGSSYSAAEVSGMATVLIATKPELTNTQVYSLIISGAKKGQYFLTGYGSGSVNLENSLNILNPPVQNTPVIIPKKAKVLGAKIYKAKVQEKKPVVKKKPIKPRS